jgi:hypothetical protein
MHRNLAGVYSVDKDGDTRARPRGDENGVAASRRTASLVGLLLPEGCFSRRAASPAGSLAVATEDDKASGDDGAVESAARVVGDCGS